MTEKETRVWTCLLENRHASNQEISLACDVTEDFVRYCISRIGTPEEIWRNGTSVSSERVSLLSEAAALTAGDRNKTYGDPVENMQHIADIFNAWTGLDLTARQVAQVHVATKMARRTTTPDHRDSYVDAMAYTGIEYECVKSTS